MEKKKRASVNCQREGRRVVIGNATMRLLFDPTFPRNSTEIYNYYDFELKFYTKKIYWYSCVFKSNVGGRDDIITITTYRLPARTPLGTNRHRTRKKK